jgi:hypothetical protein
MWVSTSVVGQFLGSSEKPSAPVPKIFKELVLFWFWVLFFKNGTQF